MNYSIGRDIVHQVCKEVNDALFLHCDVSSGDAKTVASTVDKHFTHESWIFRRPIVPKQTEVVKLTTLPPPGKPKIVWFELEDKRYKSTTGIKLSKGRFPLFDIALEKCVRSVNEEGDYPLSSTDKRIIHEAGIPF